MQLKFNCPKDFGTIVTEKAPTRADYLLNDALITRQAHNAITDSIWGDERVSKEQRDRWIQEEESKIPQVGDEFILPKDNHCFYLAVLPSGKHVKMLYLQEKNTGRLVRLYVSSILASVGNFAPMLKKDPSYDERFFGKTISIDNEFYEEVGVYDKHGYQIGTRNHKVYEINIKD